jgi:two-component system alkaline phosphatase synthesis response regulator PhoP
MLTKNEVVFCDLVLLKSEVMYFSEQHPTRVLLVDDEPDIIEFLSYNFRKEGYEVLTAYDGKQAIEVSNKRQPDVIITDILMPNMNGIAFCEQLKTRDTLKQVPVIFLSASNDDLFAMAAMKAGGSRYVSKPIRFNVLKLMVQELLEKPNDQFFKRRFKS